MERVVPYVTDQLLVAWLAVSQRNQPGEHLGIFSDYLWIVCGTPKHSWSWHLRRIILLVLSWADLFVPLSWSFWDQLVVLCVKWFLTETWVGRGKPTIPHTQDQHPQSPLRFKLPHDTKWNWAIDIDKNLALDKSVESVGAINSMGRKKSNKLGSSYLCPCQPGNNGLLDLPKWWLLNECVTCWSAVIQSL